MSFLMIVKKSVVSCNKVIILISGTQGNRIKEFQV